MKFPIGLINPKYSASGINSVGEITPSSLEFQRISASAPEHGIPGFEISVEELIKKADIAMYDAKCTGKNRVAYYDENVISTSFKRLDLEKNMRNATRNAFDEFEVVQINI